MVLRLEDLDPDRCKRPAWCDGVDARIWRWLGLDWDEGGSTGGDGYYQSHRGAYYQAALEQLKQMDLLYPCFCTRARNCHAPNAPHRSDGAGHLPGHLPKSHPTATGGAGQNPPPCPADSGAR